MTRRRLRDRTVLMAPFLRSNPYQQLLGTALQRHGWGVRMAAMVGGPVPLVQAWRAARRPAVLHLHWTHPLLGGAGGRVDPVRASLLLAQLVVLRRLGVRIVWTLHNLSGHDRADDRLERFAHHVLVGRCDVVVAHCHAAVDMAIERYRLHDTHRRFRVIPHGSFQPWYGPIPGREEARRRLGLPAEGIVLLSLGRIRPYKGLPELLDAFRAVPAPTARLVIAGAPEPGTSSADLLAAAVRDPRVRLRIGHLSDEAIAELLGASDAAVLPYRDVLTSGSAVLAMGAGLPVIAPRRGCLPEQVPEYAGLLYDADAPDALEAALREALTMDLDTAGRRALAGAASPGWDAIAEATIEAYVGERRPITRVRSGSPGGVQESGA